MKKIQIVLAGGALLLASAGVFANNLFVTTFYRSTVPGAICTTVLTSAVPSGCTGDDLQCTKLETINGEQVTVYISRIVDSNPCEMVERDI